MMHGPSLGCEKRLPINRSGDKYGFNICRKESDVSSVCTSERGLPGHGANALISKRAGAIKSAEGQLLS